MAALGKTAVLLGAGHAHLYSLRRAARFRQQGVRLVLIAPGPFWYSGLATGMLGGGYPPERDQIDVAELVCAGGGEFVPGRALRVDPHARRVFMEDGQEIAYDALSINVGSEAVHLPGADGAAANVYPLKPLASLARLRRDLEAVSSAPRRLVVVGGGASGGEIAMNLRALLDRLGATRSEVRLLSAGDGLFESFAPSAASKATRLLQARGVQVAPQTRVVRVEDHAVVTRSGERVAFDFLVNAAGLRPPPLLRASGLSTDESGAMRVNRFLQALDHPAIFGGGDCVAFEERPLAKIGVYAVRQAPVLCHNLLATLAGAGAEGLRPFEPQRRYLQILNVGDGTALAVRGSWSWHGRAAFWLKDYLDRRFLAASGQGA